MTIENGSFAGNGLVDMTGGTVVIEQTNTLGGVQPWLFNNLTLGDGSSARITTPSGTATTTVRGVLTIAAGHFLDAGSSHWTLSGTGNPFIETGTFLEDTSSFTYSGNGANIRRTAYYNLAVDTTTGTAYATAPTTGLQVLNNLAVGKNGTSTLNVNTNDPLLAVGGDVYIGNLGTLLASDTNLIEVYGGWNNDGVFTANGSLVEFYQVSGSSTIAAGNSSFADVSFLGNADFTIRTCYGNR
ncbi:MAG: hypothetical protein R3B69_00380 [Candidatus Paceibacterota bacterium]